MPSPDVFEDFGNGTDRVLSHGLGDDPAEDRRLGPVARPKDARLEASLVSGGRGALAGRFSAKLTQGPLERIATMSTGDETSIEAVLSDPVPGLSLRFIGRRVAHRDSTGKPAGRPTSQVSAECRHGMVAFSCTVDPVQRAVCASAAVGKKEMALGAKASCSAGVVEGIEVGAHYARGGDTASCLYEVNRNALRIKTLHEVDSRVSLAARLELGAARRLDAGLVYKVDKLSVARFKVGTDALVALHYTRKMNPSLTLGVGGSTDTHNLSKSRFGISVLAQG